MGWKLASLYVELAATGFEAFKGKIDETEKKMQVLKLAAQDAVKSTNESFRGWAKDMLAPDKTRAAELALESMKAKTAQVGQSFKTLHSTATWAFAGITTSTLLWVRAGLQGTTIGNALTIQFQMLSRQIASVFVPQIRALVEGVRNLVGWFRGLSGEQQSLIGKVIITAAAMTGIVMVLPTLVSGVGTLITVWKALNVAFIASPIGATIALIVALAAGTEQGRASIMRLIGVVSKLVGPLVEAAAGMAEFISALAGGVVELFVKAIEKIVKLMDDLLGQWETIEKKVDAAKRDPTDPLSVEAFEEFKKGSRPHLVTFGIDDEAHRAQYKFDAKGKPRDEVTSGHIGFESANQTYRRIAEHGLQHELATEQKKTNDKLDRANEHLAAIAGRGGAKPQPAMIGP